MDHLHPHEQLSSADERVGVVEVVEIFVNGAFAEKRFGCFVFGELLRESDALVTGDL
jgi:hypothetical protein